MKIVLTEKGVELAPGPPPPPPGASGDPPIPADGTCAGCGKRRGRDAKNARARMAAATDPFCSSECAKRWHGVPLTAESPRAPRGYVSKVDAGR